MSCTGWESRVAAYCSGPVDAAEAAAVDSHLNTCPACRLVAEETRACAGVLRDSDYAGVRARVLSKVGSSRRAFWTWAAAATVAAASVLVFLGTPAPKPEPLPVRAIATPPAPPIAFPAAIPAARHIRRAAMRRVTRHKVTSVAAAKPETKPLVVKLLTDDPNVVIYWITGKSGE